MVPIKNIAELESLQKQLVSERDTEKTFITVCSGTGCRSNNGLNVAEALNNALKAESLDVEVKLTGCHGFCERGPIVVIEPEGIFYVAVGRKKLEKDAEEIVASLKEGAEPVKRLLYRDSETKEIKTYYNDIPFYSKQKRVALRNNGMIDPCSIEDYLAKEGYGSLAKVIGMEPEDVIRIVEDSDLRGRGGAGFATGTKWRSCRQAPGEICYILCNGDEGDPGAFMDRSIMEGDPHSVLEGMIIAAWAISGGVSRVEGYIYVRAEYPLAVTNLTMAIEQARECGLLGDDILGSGLSFDIHINQGAGAFVCGESSALMRSIEGRSGEPRVKYIRSVEQGLWGMPTNLNNVETYANIPVIIKNGARWFKDIGVKDNGGTKVFSLVGKVKNTGLVEVPMGTSVRDVVFGIGSGILLDKPFKAVQTGGPSGGCIPEELLDLPLTYEGLTEAGSMMGSGGMIVLDSETCMVDVARYYLNFTAEESCGKCIPCREGTKRMLKILDRICVGEGCDEDIQDLERISKAVAATSLCGLGKSAPNPVISTLKYFREEYEAHINEKKCPAGVCKALISYRIDPDKCTGCGVCRKNCPVDAITGEKKEAHVLNPETCVKCGACREGCKFDAVIVE